MLEYDTESKKAKCMCDEEEVEFGYAGFYCDDEGRCRMEVGMKTKEEGGLKKYTTLVASKVKDSIPFGKYFLTTASNNWFNKIFKS